MLGLSFYSLSLYILFNDHILDSIIAHMLTWSTKTRKRCISLYRWNAFSFRDGWSSWRQLILILKWKESNLLLNYCYNHHLWKLFSKNKLSISVYTFQKNNHKFKHSSEKLVWYSVLSVIYKLWNSVWKELCPN